MVIFDSVLHESPSWYKVGSFSISKEDLCLLLISCFLHMILFFHFLVAHNYILVYMQCKVICVLIYPHDDFACYSSN